MRGKKNMIYNREGNLGWIWDAINRKSSECCKNKIMKKRAKGHVQRGGANIGFDLRFCVKCV
jgi:hypothetical protein